MIRYIRDGRNPVGCVVADVIGSKIKFGISFCNPKDKFNKKTAVEHARMNMGCTVPVPNRKISYMPRIDDLDLELVLTFPRKTTVEEELIKIKASMVNRIMRKLISSGVTCVEFEV